MATKNWLDTLKESATLLGRSENARKKASALLWDGAKSGIEGWDSDKDPHAEAFYADALDALGTARKGDASKIKTVALAVRNEGLDISEFTNLAKAYGAAVALTKTKKTHAEEDDAAEEAITAIAAEAPKTASTAEAAVKIVLAKGVDEAARLLVEALGAENVAAHRSLLRALGQEIAGRQHAVAEQAKAEKAEATEKARAEREAKRAEAAKARAERAAKKPVAKKAAAKPRGAAKKAAVAKPAAAKPVAKKAIARPKGKPVARKA